MLTVYADVVFLYNFIMDYLVLYVSGKVLNVKRKNVWLILAASVGGIYGVMSRIIFLAEPWCAVSVSVIMILTAFEIKNTASFAKSLVLFYMAGMLFGGIMTFLQRIFYTYKDIPLFKNGIDIWTYFMFAAVIFIFSVTAGKIFRMFIHTSSVNAEIYYADRKKKVRLLCDSGNLLRDPYSGMPVVVVKADVIDGILGRDGVHRIHDNADAQKAAEYKLRFIPVKTVSGSALIPAIGALKIRYCDKRKRRELDAVIAADIFSSSDYGGNDGVIPHMAV